MTDIDKVAPSRAAMPSADLRTLLSRAAIVVLSALLLFCLLLRLMNYEMRKDEQLYVPPIRLLDHYRLYEDFFYNHPPDRPGYSIGSARPSGRTISCSVAGCPSFSPG